MNSMNGKILALLCGATLLVPATQWAQSAPAPATEARKGPATPPPLFFIDGVKQTPPKAAAEPTANRNDARAVTTSDAAKASAPAAPAAPAAAAAAAKVPSPALLDSCAACAAIRPEDIASVEVLKGAKAIELYGVEATYGVVLIVTKPGAKKP